jgi:hypothetical protein
MKQITLTFHKDGSVEKEVDGFSSSKCLNETDFIDQAIGKAIKTEMKQEFYAPEVVGIDQQAHISI